jgi:hypothetical protein
MGSDLLGQLILCTSKYCGLRVGLMSRAQFVNTDMFSQFTDDSGLGPDILDWQGLHQPPW